VNGFLLELQEGLKCLFAQNNDSTTITFSNLDPFFLLSNPSVHKSFLDSFPGDLLQDFADLSQAEGRFH
jgi:hypothetical protein